MRRLLLLAMLILGSVALIDAPARAAEDCAPGGFVKELKAAKSVFSGEVTEIREPAPTGGRMTYVVQVDRVYTTGPTSGTVTAQKVVTTPGTAKACGVLDVKVGSSYVFLSPKVEDPYLTHTYDGTRRLTPAVTAQVVKTLGSGKAPVVADSTTTSEILLHEDPPEFWSLALPGALLGLVGLIALAVARALGRPKESHT